MEFKYVLRNLRREKGISGEELGKVIGVKKTAISYWENGRNYPNQETMQKLVEYFNVSYDFLMGKTDIRNTEVYDAIKNYEKHFKLEQNIDIDPNSIEFALYGEVKDLTDEQKQLVLDLARGLKGK